MHMRTTSGILLSLCIFFALPAAAQSGPPPVSTTPMPIEDVEGVQLRSGYAVITPNASNPLPLASLTYGMVHGGEVEAQAAILPDAPVTQTTLPLDVVPGIGRNVGVAVANSSGVPASIVIALRDDDGTPVGTPVSLTIQNAHQFAKFVTELFPASAFGAALRGTLAIQSTTPVSIVGLRFSGTEFSTIPVPPAVSTASPGTIVFPQFAMGGSWATTVVVMNPTDSTISGRINIFDPDGNPFFVRLNGVSSNTDPFTYSLPRHGSFTLARRDSNGQSPF